MVEDVERKKKWEQDEVFAVLGERVHLAVYIRTQKGKEGAPSSSKAVGNKRGCGISSHFAVLRSSSSDVLL